MLVGDDDIVSWRKPFNTPLGSFHTCCRRQPTKAALRLQLENGELRHGVAVTKKQCVGAEIESQVRLAVHKCERLKPTSCRSIQRPLAVTATGVATCLISLSVVSEARVSKLHTRARCVCALSIQRLEGSRPRLRPVRAK